MARKEEALKVLREHASTIAGLRVLIEHVQKRIEEKAPALPGGPPIDAVTLLRERLDAIAEYNLHIANLERENEELQSIVDESD